MNAATSAGTPTSPWRFCLAPMMRRTDRHFRYLVRLLSPHLRLYTEMITSGAIVHGDRARLLDYAPQEQPLALQLGGSDPDELARCASIAADWGYAEINLNCGCPSDRVQAGAFGACLMREPTRVAACVTAMRAALPDTMSVSVKTRLGVDDLYSYDYFRDFVGQLAAAGCEVFHVHARKAWLSGLNPRENREIPPLEYAWVYRLKNEFPALTVVINGGIERIDDAIAHLHKTDGVMLGRHAYADPYSLAAFDAALFGAAADTPSEAAVIDAFLPYVRQQLESGVHLKHLSRHLLQFFQGQPGAREWRRTLTVAATDPAAGCEVIESALARQRLASEQVVSLRYGS